MKNVSFALVVYQTSASPGYAVCYAKTVYCYLNKNKTKNFSILLAVPLQCMSTTHFRQLLFNFALNMASSSSCYDFIIYI